MAKKKAAKERDAGKTRLELRLDDVVYEKARGLADKAGISTNQLVLGLVRWFAERAIVGEPYRNKDGLVCSRPQEGCLWVGEPGEVLPEDYRRQIAADEGCSLDEVERVNKGEIKLFLDFTERRVVREDV